MSLAPTSLRSDEHPGQPVGLSGVEFLEFSIFSSANADALQKLLEALGFAAVARHRSKDVLLFRQGDINLVLNRTPSSFAHSFATMHGTSGVRGGIPGGGRGAVARGRAPRRCEGLPAVLSGPGKWCCPPFGPPPAP